MLLCNVTVLVSCLLTSGCVLVDSPLSVVLAVHPPTLSITRLSNSQQGSHPPGVPVVPSMPLEAPKE